MKVIFSIPEFDDKGNDVLAFQTALKAAGFDPGALDGHFGPKTKAACSAYQKSIGLPGSGIPGPTTIDRLDLEIAPAPPISNSDLFGAPWMEFMFDRLGWTEFSHDKELAQYWPLVGLKGYKTVKGGDHAWCAMIIEPAFRSVGLKGSGSAGAASYRDFAEEADDYWFGAPISFQHPSGGNHVTFFLYWVDKAKGLAACCGGNQSNALNVTVYNLKKEKVRTGPRWPKGWPKGQVVTEAQGKALLKGVGYAAPGSTR